MKRRLPVVVGALAAIGLVVVLRACLKSGGGRTEDPGAGPTGIAVAWNDVEFVEVVYEQAFGPITAGSAPVEPAPDKWRAYTWQPEARSIVATAAPPATKQLIGRRATFLHAVHAPFHEELLASEADVWRWSTAEPAGALPGADLVSALRVPADLELAFRDGTCTATCGGKSAVIAAGKSAEVWAGTREFAAAEYVAALKAAPGALVEAADEKRLLEAAKGGKIVLHARLVVAFRGGVRVAAFDAAATRRKAEEALRDGDTAKARDLVRLLMALRPDDEWAWELWRRAVTASGKPRPARVKGRVTFPAPLPEKGVPPFVVIRDPAGEAGSSVAAQAAFGGACELRVPPGKYVVAARAPGYREISKAVDVAGDCEVTLEFTDADRAR